MNKYFIQLFLEESTVIIPDLGALTMTNADSGEIMFLPYLKFDDGKLADFIAKTEGVDKIAATNMISKFVREIKAKLDQGDSYDIFEFGSFDKNEDGEIEFTSFQIMSDNKQASHTEDANVDLPINQEIQEEVEEEEGLSFELNADEPIEEKISSEDLLKQILGNTSAFDPTSASDASEEENTEESISGLVNDSVDEEKPVVVESNPTIIDEPSVSPIGNEGEVENVKETEPFAKQLENQEFKENELLEKPVVVKKKRRLSFAALFLWFLLLCIAGGGVWSYFNFDKIKPHLPFLSEQKSEIPSVLNSDEEHIKIMKELSGMTDSTEYDDLEEMEEAEPVEEPKKVAETPKKKVEEPKKDVVKKVQPQITNTEKPKAQTAEVKKPVKPTPSKIVGSSGSGNNFIIVGSFSTSANAENLVKKLKGMGYDAMSMANGANTVVSAGNFATVEEATAFLNQNKTNLGNGWILKK